MENKLQEKTKLIVSMLALVSILIFLAVVIIEAYYSKINSLIVLNEQIALSRDISSLIHSLQKERGLSSGYVTNSNGKFKIEMLQERIHSDKYVKNLLEKFKKTECNKLKKEKKRLQEKLSSLYSIREAIDQHKYQWNEVIEEYSKINTFLLDIIIDIAKTSHIPSITQNILAYSYLLYYKEYLGLQRAQGVILLSSQSFDKESFTKFVNLMAIAEQNKAIFLKYASEPLQQYYFKYTKSNTFKKVKEIETKIVSTDQKTYKVQAKEWYNLMTKKLNIIDKISKHIEKRTELLIKKELYNAKLFFFIIILVLVASWFLFIYVMLHLLKLIKNEQRLRLVMDKYVISSMTDLKGNIIDVSQAFCDISGYTKEELLGKKHNIVRHPDMPKEVFTKLWNRITQGKSWSGKVKNRRKDKSSYWVYANVEPLYNANNEIEAYISVRMDITENEVLNQKIKAEEERNKLQEKIMQQQHRLAQMGEMIAMIAHQWRQPLSAITAASGAIMIKASRDRLSTEQAVELAQKIQDFSKHLSTTIDDFRNFFKSKKQKQITNFQQVTQSVLAIVDGSLVRNNIEISCKYDNVEDFISYENELKQVLLNLIKNSEDALNERDISDKKIEIYVQKRTLKIHDNAGGIDESILSKIFDPYFSTKMKKDGTGLGLYMSKVIIEEHCNGKLQVQNTTDGALFEIDLGESDD